MPRKQTRTKGGIVLTNRQKTQIAQAGAQKARDINAQLTKELRDARAQMADMQRELEIKRVVLSGETYEVRRYAYKFVVPDQHMGRAPHYVEALRHEAVQQIARAAQESGAIRQHEPQYDRDRAATTHTIGMFVLVPKSPMKQLPREIVL